MATVFSFAFHGGAGLIPRDTINPDVYQPSLEAVLRKTFEFAENNLNNDSITAVDVVEFAVQALEVDPLYNAGRGAVLATNGEHQLEASIMDGATLQSGSVSMIKNYPSPVKIARLVMDSTCHVYMVGEGAEDLAAKHGFSRVADNSYFTTPLRKEQLRAALEAQGVYGDHGIPNTATAEEFPAPATESTLLGDTDTGTVGAVCYYKGSVAAATSTGGMTNKLSGRIGDTPIIGAGTYANNATCAISSTGKGEYFIRSVCAYDISARMQYGGMSLEQAAWNCIHAGVQRSRVPLGEEAAVLGKGSGGVIGVDYAGEVTMPFNSQGMFRGWAALRRGDERSARVQVGQVGIWEELWDIDFANSGDSAILQSISKSNNSSSTRSRSNSKVKNRSRSNSATTGETTCKSSLTLLKEIDPTDVAGMQRIGELRYKVWEEENSINAELFPNRCWIDPMDNEARHWIVEMEETGEIMATARLTLHNSLEDSSRDVQIWRRCGKHLPLPTVDLGRLVVYSAYRGRGLAQMLNKVRITAAREMGAKSVMVTASEGNARLLRKLGFEDIGETVSFDDRPNTVFYAMQLNL